MSFTIESSSLSFFVHNGINIPPNPLNSYMFGSVLDKSEMGTSTASTYSVLYFLWRRVVRLCSPCTFSELCSLSLPELPVSKTDIYWHSRYFLPGYLNSMASVGTQCRTPSGCQLSHTDTCKGILSLHSSIVRNTGLSLLCAQSNPEFSYYSVQLLLLWYYWCKAWGMGGGELAYQ